MATVSDLERRLDAEVAAINARINELREAAVRAHEEREARYTAFTNVAAALAENVCKPRLEVLMKRFPEAAYTKLVMQHGRGVRLDFNSKFATVAMEVAVHPVDETDDLVLTYDLTILPIFLEFERHAELRLPVATVDHDEVARWLDDRLVAFAKTYFAIQFTEQYQSRNLAVDPVASIRFPISFAAGSVTYDGVTYYFLSDETKVEFERNPKAFVADKQTHQA